MSQVSDYLGGNLGFLWGYFISPGSQESEDIYSTVLWNFLWSLRGWRWGGHLHIVMMPLCLILVLTFLAGALSNRCGLSQNPRGKTVQEYCCLLVSGSSYSKTKMYWESGWTGIQKKGSLRLKTRLCPWNLNKDCVWVRNNWMKGNYSFIWDSETCTILYSSLDLRTSRIGGFQEDWLGTKSPYLINCETRVWGPRWISGFLTYWHV